DVCIMKTRFAIFQAKDGIVLHGLLFEPDERCQSLVVHLHGMAGNFYENSFIPVLAEQYTENGIALLVFNNRGHDYICDLVRVVPGGTDSLKGGFAYESIEECLFDVEGALSYAARLGYERIVLQGHSSGANKIVYSMAQKLLNVTGVALLSPCDDVGLHLDEVKDRRIQLKEQAQELVKAGTPEALMPLGTFYDYWLSAATYLACFEDGSVFDTFPYRDEDASFSMYSSIKVPIFVSCGTDGEYLLQSITEVREILSTKTSNTSRLSFEVIEGASHSYGGKEKELASRLVKWLRQVTG